MSHSDALDPGVVRSAAGPVASRVAVEVLAEVDSTNAALLRRPRGERHAVVLLAERQASGRGRRGRQWHSPPGCNVYLSLGWRFESIRSDFAMLPLAVAVAAAKALRVLGAEQVAVKWPNDLWLNGRKAGGCLVESAPGAGGAREVVVGVGVNVGMTGSPGAEVIDRDWADLRDSVPGVRRSQVAGELINQLVRALEAFTAVGFSRFAADWVRLDALRGQAVEVEREQDRVTGRALGLGPSGGLLVDTSDGPVECLAGDASVHAVDGRRL